MSVMCSPSVRGFQVFTAVVQMMEHRPRREKLFSNVVNMFFTHRRYFMAITVTNKCLYQPRIDGLFGGNLFYLIQTVADLSQHLMFLEKLTQKLPSLALMSVCEKAECISTKQPQCALHCNTKFITIKLGIAIIYTFH